VLVAFADHINIILYYMFILYTSISASHFLYSEIRQLYFIITILMTVSRVDCSEIIK
jgi:hypothetical protein